MNYEKKYKEALERAREIHNEHRAQCFDVMVKVFPELKESEDERIRKALINVFSTHQGYEVFFGASVEDILAWLEKQGEKESDPRYENLEEILAADDIYQMSMNDEMVQEAKEKAVNALSGICIGRLLGLEKQCKETSWKPSKEEMDVLYGLSYITNEFDERKEEVITRLYQDLKREFFNGASFENMFPTNTSVELEKQGEQKPIISNNALREGIAHFGITQYQIDNWLKKYVDVENLI